MWGGVGGHRKLVKASSWPWPALRLGLARWETSQCTSDLLITCSRARATVKFEAQPKALGSTASPPCTGLSTDRAVAMASAGCPLRKASWRRRGLLPSVWWGPSTAPASWAGWCWLSPAHHVRSSSGSRPPGSEGATMAQSDWDLRREGGPGLLPFLL